MVPFPMTLSDA